MFMTRDVIRVAAMSASVLLAGPLAMLAPAHATASACLPLAGLEPPNPGGAGGTDLNGIAVVSSCSAWAVGSFEPGPQPIDTLILRWDGTSWTQVAGPDPNSATQNNELLGVASVSARDAWAVGASSVPGSERTLISHWNGQHWNLTPSPNASDSGNELNAVTATTASNAWAVGFGGSLTLIERWNGKRWAVVRGGGARSAGELSGVTATSGHDAWAVGQRFNRKGFPQTLITHWNGKAWKTVPSPDPAGASGINVLFGVDASSASNAWAVGYTQANSGTRTLILRWNGKAWKAVPSPNPGGAAPDNILRAVTVTGTRNAWAVGSAMNGKLRRTLLVHWDGKTWQRIPSPDPGSHTNDSLLSIDATSARNAWAIGVYFSANQPDQTIAIHCC